MKKSYLLFLFALSRFISLAQIPSNGLIAYYPMRQIYSVANPTITQHDDLSGNNYHLSTSNAFGFGTGRSGGNDPNSGEFNGANNDLRRYDYTNNQSVFQVTGDFTISAWVRVSSSINKEYNNIVTVGDNDIYLRVRRDPTSTQLTFQGGFKTASSAWVNINSITYNASAFTGIWTLVTLRKTGSNLEILFGTSINNNSAFIGNHFYGTSYRFFTVGNATQTNPSSAFIGSIQDVFFYNRSLTTTEMVQLACSPVNITASTPSTQNVCTGTFISHTVASTPTVSNGNYNWYTTGVGGTVFSSGTILTLGNVTQNSIYYADAMSTAGCISYPRLPFRVTVQTTANPQPVNTTPTNSLTVACGSTTTLTATGSDLTWYATASGGTSLGTGGSFVTPAINGSTTYYVQSGSGACASSRTAITVNNTTIPAPTNTTTAANSTICSGTSTVVSASGSNLVWFNVATGGTSIGTGTSYTTPTLTTNTTYYVQSGNGSCASNRTGVPVSIYSGQAPIHTNANFTTNVCAGISYGLQASGSGTLNWYNVPTGGTSLGSGTIYTTAPMPNPNSLNETLTVMYYVDATNCNITSARTPITMTVKYVYPFTSNGPTDFSICSGETVTLSVNTTAPSNQVRWTFGFFTEVGTGTSFTTPVLTSNTSYTAELNMPNGCGASFNYNITVNTTQAPTPTNTTPSANLTICNSNTTVLSANGNNLTWYTTPTGGTSVGSGSSFTTPTLNSNQTYYVQSGTGNCASSRLAIPVTVNQTPSNPNSNTTASNLSICQGNGTTLSVTAPSGVATTSWWANASGGTALSSGNTYTIPASSLNQTTTFYVSHVNGNCSSSRVAIQVVVNPSPAAPNDITPSQLLTVCAGNSTDLSVSSSAGVRWYNVATGGTSLSSNAIYTTPALTSIGTSNFYVESFIGTCVSTRTLIAVSVVANPSIPSNTTPTANLSVCSGSAATLEAQTTESGVVLRWYQQANGGTILGTGSPFTTNAITNNSTFYVASFRSSTGCSSQRIPITVVVKQPTSATIAQTACGSYVLNGSTYTNSGTYIQNLINVAGCDSTLTLQLTINQPNSSTITTTNCGPVTFNNQTFTQSGTYTQTLTNQAGCDSVITLNLTINPTNAVSLTESACGSFTYNNQTYTNSGTYQIQLSNTYGCDSIVTLNLTIGQDNASTVIQNACGSFSLGGNIYTTSGVYTVIIPNVSGCDSTITLDLTIDQPTASTVTETACGDFTFNGQNYSTSGTYTQTIPNAAGCDSVITLNLTINSVIPTITLNGGTLSTSATGGTYQWVNCDTEQNVAGANSQTFTPTVTGNYAVEFSINGCTEISNCLSVTVVGLEDLGLEKIAIAPNPTKDNLTISTSTNTTITIVNLLGEQLMKAELSAGENQIQTENFVPGVYLIETVKGQTIRFVKL